MINLSFNKTKTSPLADEIERLHEQLKNMTPTDEDYATVADQLTKLYKLLEIESKGKVSKDVLVNAAANLIGIVTIISFEHTHALATKALGFVKKS